MEIKQKIRNYFVKQTSDKFTNIIYYETKKSLEFKGPVLKDKFIVTQNLYSHILKIDLKYCEGEGEDLFYFVFTYFNREDGFPGMDNLRFYLILDDNETIELNEVLNHAYDAYTNTETEYPYNAYIEITHLKVTLPILIKLANATNIEYSIRFSNGILNGLLKDSIFFKGFYNAVFDSDFELEKLSTHVEYSSIKSKSSKKNEGCYIATAIYGDYDHPQVMHLRNFRDDFLRNYFIGKKLIKFYYWLSPKCVDKLKEMKCISFFNQINFEPFY